MRYLRFWMTGVYPTDELTGLRGQHNLVGSDETLLHDFDRVGERWICQRWEYLPTDPDAHAKRLICEHEDVFFCMTAAELDAKRIVESMLETEDDF